MTRTANDTLLFDEPVVRRMSPPPYPAGTDRTADLTRIIRRVLRNPGSNTPLSQAIRAAWETALPGEDEAVRIRQIALQMDTLLSERAAAQPACAGRRETVRF